MVVAPERAAAGWVMECCDMFCNENVVILSMRNLDMTFSSYSFTRRLIMLTVMDTKGSQVTSQVTGGLCYSNKASVISTRRHVSAERRRDALLAGSLLIRSILRFIENNWWVQCGSWVKSEELRDWWVSRGSRGQTKAGVVHNALFLSFLQVFQ